MNTIPYQAWFVIAAVLAVVEMLTGTFYLFVLALASVGSGFASWCGVSLTVQLCVAVGIAVLGFILAHKLKRARHGEFVNLDTGNPVEWTGKTSDGYWRVRYRGTDWQARPESPDTDPAAPLVISAIQGNILIVKNF